jgi:hypothetical protein
MFNKRRLGRVQRQADRCFIANEGREVSGPRIALVVLSAGRVDRAAADYGVRAAVDVPRGQVDRGPSRASGWPNVGVAAARRLMGCMEKPQRKTVAEMPTTKRGILSAGFCVRFKG